MSQYVNLSVSLVILRLTVVHRLNHVAIQVLNHMHMVETSKLNDTSSRTLKAVGSASYLTEL